MTFSVRAAASPLLSWGLQVALAERDMEAKNAESGEVRTTAVPYRRMFYFVMQATCVDTTLPVIATGMAWAG